MKSASRPRCGRGQDCYHVRKLRSSAPARVGQEGDLCEKCISDEPSLEDVPADHEAVVRAAQVLLQHNVEDENVIIPSMVFAALAAESPIFKKIANECAEGWLDDAQRKTLELKFSNTIEAFWPEDVISGVLLVRRNPIRPKLFFEPSTGVVTRITIDVIDRSAQLDEVTRIYERALALENLDYARSDAGEISWKIYQGAIHMAVRPENPDTDFMSNLEAGRARQQLPFPPPKFVGEMYGLLRGSRAKDRFGGFGDAALSGRRGQGVPPEGKTLTAGCAAWYLTDRGRRIDDAKRKREVTDLLLQQLASHIRDYTIEHGTLWRAAKKYFEVMREVERAMLSSVGLLYGALPKNKFF